MEVLKKTFHLVLDETISMCVDPKFINSQILAKLKRLKHELSINSLIDLDRSNHVSLF